MVVMEHMRRWVARGGTVLTAATLAVFVPAVAWASTNGVYDVAGELVRGRRRVGGVGLFAGLCCLVVVLVAVLGLVLMMQRRRRR
jgi:hypothetical protein